MFGSQKFVYSSDLDKTLQINSEKYESMVNAWNYVEVRPDRALSMDCSRLVKGIFLTGEQNIWHRGSFVLWTTRKRCRRHLNSRYEAGDLRFKLD